MARRFSRRTRMRRRQSPAANVAARRVATFLTGLAGLIAFNVIIGVFGLVAAGVGLVAFIVTALFVIARSSRREQQTHG
jgi:Flp pilus assembly protein TadB